ncbi:hypothetical protein C8R42DRAFT_644610 [Lentinula raphanica]|nr:hypothetical protein C8R42DRAFT_644610 [Lentinula raphanica]
MASLPTTEPTPVNTSSSPGTSSEEPGSPLTPIEDTFSTFVDSNNPPDARPIFIPKPNNPNINNIGWASASLKAYRTQAREAVESAVAFFRAYEDHWAAKLLLKDQLKSVKDTRTKAEARKGKKQKEKEQEKKDTLKSDADALENSNLAVQYDVTQASIIWPKQPQIPKLDRPQPNPRNPILLQLAAFTLLPLCHEHASPFLICRYRVFFQRHQSLPTNVVLGIQGDLIVMRVGSKNIENVVNARKGDSGRIRTLAQRGGRDRVEKTIDEAGHLIQPLYHSGSLAQSSEKIILMSCLSQDSNTLFEILLSQLVEHGFWFWRQQLPNPVFFKSPAVSPYQTYSRKRTNDTEAEDCNDAAALDSSTSTPYDKKEKYRAVAGPDQMKFDQLMREVQELKKANMFLTSRVTVAEQKAEELTASAEEAYVTISMMDSENKELHSQIAASEMDVDRSVQENQPGQSRRTGEPEDPSIAVLSSAKENQANQQQQVPQMDADRIAQIRVNSSDKCYQIQEKEQALQNALTENQWFRQQIDATRLVCTALNLPQEEREIEILELRNQAKSRRTSPNSPNAPPQTPSATESMNMDMDPSSDGTPSSSGPLSSSTPAGPSSSTGSSSSSTPTGSTSSSGPSSSSTPTGFTSSSGSSSRGSGLDYHAIIRETIAATMAAQATQGSPSTTPRSSKRKNQMPKLGSVAYRDQLKKNALDSISDDDERAWRNFLRERFRTATGQDTINSFQSYTPIKDHVAKAFEDGTGLGPTGDTKHRLYFGTNYSRSAWNKIVINNILQTVPGQRQELRYQLCDLDIDIQSAMLWDFIKQAQVSWFQKFERRKRDIASLLEKAEPNSLDRTHLQRTKDVLLTLGVDGQSSEESGEEDTFLVTVPHYRRRIITSMMSDLDKHAKDLSKEQWLVSKRAMPRPKHIRERSNKISTRTTKKGLPRSLYHRQFLQQLPPSLLERLHVDSKETPNFEQWALAVQADSDSDSDEDI